jgi:hypothetical protein
MTQTVLHFVFTPSGAGCLVQALRKAGRADQVIASVDDLSFGPIDPPDSSLRAKWVENELGQADWRDIAAQSARSWNEALFPDSRKVAWLTRRTATEYAGFLEWLWRMDDAPCEVVDLTDVTVSYRPEHGPPWPPQLAMSIAMLHPDIIRSDTLWELAEPLEVTERRRYRELWQQLRSENAPLRIIEDGKLVSAPISFFDPLLMSYVTEDWQKVSRIVGPAMVAQNDDLRQAGDIFLAARIEALAKTGRLEMRGHDALETLKNEVRLPTA